MSFMERFEKMKNQKLSFRKEYFGVLLYDPNNWSLKMLSKTRAKNFLHTTNKPLLIFNDPQKDFLSAPLKVFVSISASCNLHCKHCMIGKKRDQKNEMSFEEIKKVLKELGEMGVFEVRLGGLEPTARNDFEKIFAEAKKNNLTISINTNGVCSDELRKRLSESCVDRVHVSLDGLEANHDLIRCKGAFKSALKTIKVLKDKGKYVRIAVCLHKNNLVDIEGLLKIAEEFDCDIKFSPVTKIGSAEEMEGIFNKQECEALKVQIDSISAKVNVFFNYGTMAKDFSDYCEIADFDSTLCGAGRTQLRVENNGAVIMAGCGDLFSDILPLGTSKDSFKEMWKKSQNNMKELMREHGQKCVSCTIESVFSEWLAQPTPAFNFGRGDKNDKWG